MSEAWHINSEVDPIDLINDMLALPLPPNDGLYSMGEAFEPWNLFPLYGTYSADFDDCAIGVLEDLRDGTFLRNDLAAEMLRETLCLINICEYGSSPRVCFPIAEFKELLPPLIDKWKAYRASQWDA